MVLLAVLLVLPKPACSADNLSEKIKKDQQTLEKLKREIEENKRRSGEAQRQEASVLQSIEDVDHQLKRRREEVAKVTAKLKQKDHELDATSSALFRLRNRIEVRQDSIRSRLRVMYKEGPGGDMKLLLESRDSQDLLTRYAMLRWIARREYHMLEGYRDDLNQMESTNVKIRQVRSELLSYKQETAEKLADVQHERAKKDRFLTRVRSEKVLYEKVAGELEKSAQRLEALLREFEAKRKSVGVPRPGSDGEGLGKLKVGLGGRATGTWYPCSVGKSIRSLKHTYSARESRFELRRAASFARYSKEWSPLRIGCAVMGSWRLLITARAILRYMPTPRSFWSMLETRCAAISPSARLGIPV